MKLLQHFIDPYTGQTLPTTKTNICQKQFRLLDIEVERAKDHGFIEVKFYVRHLLPLANLGNCISIEWHCRNNGSKNNHLLWIDYIAGWCAASWVRLWIVQKQGRIILVAWTAKLAVWADLIWWNKCGQFSETFSGRNELWHKRVPWPRPRAGKKTVHHPYLPVCSSLLIPWQRNPYLLVFRAMQYSHLDSETDNGSSAKRHLGGGRDIHLKMLIPRCRRWHLKNIYFIRSCNVSGHIIRKGCKTINRGPILYTIH